MIVFLEIRDVKICGSFRSEPAQDLSLFVSCAVSFSILSIAAMRPPASFDELLGVFQLLRIFSGMPRLSTCVHEKTRDLKFFHWKAVSCYEQTFRQQLKNRPYADLERLIRGVNRSVHAIAERAPLHVIVAGELSIARR
jgi:hypothetical protein